jgi:hypothetical protein
VSFISNKPLGDIAMYTPSMCSIVLSLHADAYADLFE